MLASRLDESYDAEVRTSLLSLTVAKVAANSAARFAAPFAATIASGLHADLASVGGAIAIGEFAGLSAPILTRLAGRLRRRTAMWVGLVGMAAGTGVAATSTTVVQFAAGLAVLAVAKIVFDLGVIAWLTDRVEYAKVGRAIGLTEIAWAASLFIGVVLMGLLTGLTSWRWGYVLAILAIMVMAAVLRQRLPAEPARGTPAFVARHERPRLGSGWWVIGGTVALTGAVQSMSVTFGTWLQDDFGFSDARLAAVIFGLGAVEFVAASSTVRVLDAWGKGRSTMLGMTIVAPAGIALAVFHDHLWIGLAALAVFIGAFEFSVLATLSLSNSLVPSNPSTGLAMMVGAATLGRALMAPIATAAFSAHGMWLPSTIGAGCATVTWLCHARYRSLHHEPMGA